MTPDDIRQDIELKIVELLKNKLDSGEITEDRSQHVAQMVLDTLKPGMSLEELYKTIPKLDDTASELSPIILPYLKAYEQQVTQKTKENVQNLIRHGQYDAAVKLGKKAVAQDQPLTLQGSPK